MSSATPTAAATYCPSCDVTFSARKRRCDCGDALTEITRPAQLVCVHCGDVATESESGIFYDGDGEACMSCGFPGSVLVDDSAVWATSSADDARCQFPECDECTIAKLRADADLSAAELHRLASELWDANAQVKAAWDAAIEAAKAVCRSEHAARMVADDASGALGARLCFEQIHKLKGKRGAK